jgi:hypothetical protein
VTASRGAAQLPDKSSRLDNLIGSSQISNKRKVKIRRADRGVWSMETSSTDNVVLGREPAGNFEAYAKP